MKILIADDHRLVVEAVAEKMAELGPDVTVIQALSVPELLCSLSDDLDLALIDVQMPGAQGLSHVCEVRQRYPQLRVIVLSGLEDPEIMRQALDTGAMGFIPKVYSPGVMLSAVRLVLSGGVYVPPMMLEGVHDPQSITMEPQDQAGEGEPEPGEATPAKQRMFLIDRTDLDNPQTLEHWRSMLTGRQMDVLKQLSHGQANKQIGRNLGISEGTVKIHLAAIFRTLKVRNRTEAVVAARRLFVGEEGAYAGPDADAGDAPEDTEQGAPESAPEDAHGIG